MVIPSGSRFTLQQPKDEFTVDQLPTSSIEKHKNKTNWKSSRGLPFTVEFHVIFQPGSLDFPGQGKNAPECVSAVFSGGSAVAQVY